MEAFFIVWLLVMIVIFVAFLIVGLIRNEKVYQYRDDLLKEISDKARLEIDNTDPPWDWNRWYDLYNSVKYSDMVTKFWKPLDSFYDHVDWEKGELK